MFIGYRQRNGRTKFFVQWTLLRYISEECRKLEEQDARRRIHELHRMLSGDVKKDGAFKSFMAGLHTITADRCPECDSTSLVKDGKKERPFLPGDPGIATVWVQHYRCKACGHPFGARLPAAFTPGSKHPTSVRQMAFTHRIIDGCTSVDARNKIYSETGIAVGSSTIRNWTRKQQSEDMICPEPEGAPTRMAMDEQYLGRCGGTAYRMTALDLKARVPIAERVVPNSKNLDESGRVRRHLRDKSKSPGPPPSKEVDRFVADVPRKDEVEVVVTDGLPAYRKALREHIPQADHQYDVFHQEMNVTDKFKSYLSGKRKHPGAVQAAITKSRILEAFRQPTGAGVYSALGDLLDDLLAGPSGRGECVPLPPKLVPEVKKLLEDPGFRLAHAGADDLARSTGALEGYYGHTEPRGKKRKVVHTAQAKRECQAGVLKQTARSSGLRVKKKVSFLKSIAELFGVAFRPSFWLARLNGPPKKEN